MHGCTILVSSTEQIWSHLVWYTVHVAASKGRRCIQDVKIHGFAL